LLYPFTVWRGEDHYNSSSLYLPGIAGESKER